MKPYGRVVSNRSSSNPSASIRVLALFATLAEAMETLDPQWTSALIIDRRTKCRICGDSYKSERHLRDGQLYEFPNNHNPDALHWFID